MLRVPEKPEERGPRQFHNRNNADDLFDNNTALRPSLFKQSQLPAAQSVIQTTTEIGNVGGAGKCEQQSRTRERPAHPLVSPGARFGVPGRTLFEVGRG